MRKSSACSTGRTARSSCSRVNCGVVLLEDVERLERPAYGWRVDAELGSVLLAHGMQHEAAGQIRRCQRPRMRPRRSARATARSRPDRSEAVRHPSRRALPQGAVRRSGDPASCRCCPRRSQPPRPDPGGCRRCRSCPRRSGWLPWFRAESKVQSVPSTVHGPPP